jgi:LEA14-like dessication related protein
MRNLGLMATMGLVAVAACKSGEAPTKNEGEISASVDHVIAGAESLSTSLVSVKVRLENPTSQGVQVTGIEWAIDTGDLAGVLKGESPSSTALEASQKVEIEFKQSIPLPEDKDAYLAALEKGTINLTINGKVKLSNGDSLSFDRKSSVTTPRLPTFIVYDAQAARMGKEGLDVTFFLRLVNENQFAITVEGVEYAVKIGGEELKREQGAIGTRLVAGSVQEFEVSLRFDEKSFKQTKAILASKKIEYSVEGTIDLSKVQIPFELPGEIELGNSSE